MCSPQYRGDVRDVLNPSQAQYLCGNLCCCVAASGTAKTASFRELWFRPSSLTRQHRQTPQSCCESSKALFGTQEKWHFSHFYAIFPPFFLKKNKWRRVWHTY